MQIDDKGLIGFPAIETLAYPPKFFGPFQNEEQLRAWADRNVQESYRVIYLTPPSELTS